MGAVRAESFSAAVAKFFMSIFTRYQISSYRSLPLSVSFQSQKLPTDEETAIVQAPFKGTVR